VQKNIAKQPWLLRLIQREEKIREQGKEAGGGGLGDEGEEREKDRGK